MKSLFALVLCVLLQASFAAAAQPEVFNVWPGKPPGEVKELPAEEDINKPTDGLVGGKKIIKLTNVSTPTLTVYRPAKEKDTGTAIIVCPGGGHHILAFDHEGTEVAEWLQSIGVTGIVLKYRVPFRNPDKKWEAAVQDAQRAVSLVRSKAGELGVDPQRIGILGFSAGGQTAGLTSLFLNDRTYDKVDAVDDQSCRPDFAVLVYPAWISKDDEPKLRDGLQVTKDTPPMFLVHAYDDPITVFSSLVLATELKKVGVPAELHVYATGGHGFGMRKQNEPSDAWPQRCEEWLRRMNWLQPKSAS